MLLTTMWVGTLRLFAMLFFLILALFSARPVSCQEACMPQTGICETPIIYMADRKKKMLDSQLSSGEVSQTRYDVSFTSPGCDTPEMTVNNILDPSLYDIDRCTMNFWLEYAAFKEAWNEIPLILNLFPDGMLDPIDNSFFNRPSALQYAAHLGAPWSTVHALLTKGADKFYVCVNSKYDETENEAGRAAPNFCAMDAANAAKQSSFDDLAEAIAAYETGDFFVDLSNLPRTTLLGTDEPTQAQNTGYFLTTILAVIGAIAFIIIASVLYVKYTSHPSEKNKYTALKKPKKSVSFK